ncbi:uncharacterized protein [Dermacentor andersoni]|uniref:uncharacterized protein n=1 Tax=Dermacentor andersoni TaxID=34620 RepID=UPI0021557CAE|nr:TNF receptor-associated factor 6-like [Dermacentor andersoni]
MASQGKRHTLCGFTEGLDWRPLHFVDLIPSHRICNACGVLPRVTVFLPCRHALCKSCYEQCALDDGHACPLDGDQFLEDDADWREFPLQNLLRRKVKCWNEEHGCDMVFAASELNKHFCNDCDYHVMPCPKCSKLVLRSNVSVHLQSKCRDYAVCLASEALEKSGSDEKSVFTVLNASLDKRVVEIKDKLDHIISDIAQNDRLNEISHCINNVKEILLQQSNGSSTLNHRASQSAVTEKVGPMEMNKEKELAFTTISIKRYAFLAKGFKAMKDSAHLEGFHIYFSEKIYISGYHLSPGVRFTKDGDDVSLHASIQLHKGVIDEFLQWPFSSSIRMTVTHPSQSKQCQMVWHNASELEFFRRPEDSSNESVYSAYGLFSLNDLECEGYVEDDNLHILWELF